MFRTSRVEKRNNYWEKIIPNNTGRIVIFLTAKMGTTVTLKGLRKIGFEFIVTNIQYEVQTKDSICPIVYIKKLNQYLFKLLTYCR